VGTKYGSHYWTYLNNVGHETKTFKEQKDGMFDSAIEMRGTRTLDTHKYAYMKLRRITNLVLEEKDNISANSHSIMNGWMNHFCRLLNIHVVNEAEQTALSTSESYAV